MFIRRKKEDFNQIKITNIIEKIKIGNFLCLYYSKKIWIPCLKLTMVELVDKWLTVSGDSIK